MKTTADDNYEDNITTYRRLRRIVGLLGISLPIILVFLSLIPFFNTKIQSSISAYYYTNLREIFTGILCFTAIFLIRYRGSKSSSFWKNDNLLTNIAGYLALVVALLPTNPGDGVVKIYTLIPLDFKFLGYIHYGSAAIFFVILSYLSIKIFTIGQNDDPKIPVSIYNENNIYKICGVLILIFIALVPVAEWRHFYPYSTIILEALALFSFGTSWLIKGRALGDKGKIGERLYRESN